jgi:hypothetical protein
MLRLVIFQVFYLFPMDAFTQFNEMVNTKVQV